MRANRLLSILIRLQSRGRLTAQTLSEELEVSVRTIYRDIDELSASAIPVYADRGPGGGFQLVDGYQTRLTGLTANEAETLLLTGLVGAAADLGLGESLATARLKLLASVSPTARKAAERIGERFHLDPHDWYRREQAPVHLRAIAQAVWTERRVAIRYKSWSATVERKLDPLGIVEKAGVWYMVARASNGRRGYRTYKVGHVLGLGVLDEWFVYPADFDLATHWEDELKRFEASLQKEEAVLRISPAAICRLEQLDRGISSRVLQVAPDATGWRQATVPIESIERAAGFLLGFGDEVEALAPHKLRMELRTRARRVVALYQRSAAQR